MSLALQLPELLVNYFGLLNANSQHSCSLVCKTWNSAALDELWVELGSPEPLISLICRMRPQNQVASMFFFQV
ncbi:hypothetical protein ACEPAH_9633 [Sanghuangporus vaninii]